MNFETRNARIAGFLYLVVMIGAGFAEGAVRQPLIVPGDATATALAIRSAETLFRLGLVGDLLAFLSDVAISVLLYVLLKPAGKTLALTAAAFRLVAHPAIAGANLLNHYMGLIFAVAAGGSAAVQPELLESLGLLFLNLHTTGYLLAGAFFGVHLLLLGGLLIRSDRSPGWIGFLIILAGAAYLIESFGNFLAPALKGLWTAVIIGPAVAGELSLTLWLLFGWGRKRRLRNAD